MEMIRRSLIAFAAAALAGAAVAAQGGRGGAGQSPGGASATQAAPAQTPATTGNAARGKQLYLDYSCYACHGYNAQTGNGQRLLPPRLTQQVFTLYIRAPRTRQMPAYSTKLLSDAEAADIYAYILSLPREPELKDVPLLNQLHQ
jgi:mono/diheme cytochrome c family protein